MIVKTHELLPGAAIPAVEQVYNGLDCCLTLEVFEALTAQDGPLTDSTRLIYSFARAMQGPALEMMLRGFRIDQIERRNGAEALRASAERLNNVLQRMAYAVWDKPLNPRSQPQLQSFFYSTMKIPEQWTMKKGVRKLSLDRETLEKLEAFFHARPIVATILSLRDIYKQLGVLDTEIDPDGRMRTSYNIAGTETGRWSSSTSASGSGTNLQNVSPALRRMFVADPGQKLCGIDLEQAESREVGWLCGLLFSDWTYLDACEGGDLHSSVARLIWPEVAWTGDPSRDRKMADEPFYRQFSRRDMAKRGGHGTNYYGTPWTMARHLKVPVQVMEDFQDRYFTAFPAIRRWHLWVAQQLQTTQSLTTPFGRTRHFFGRPEDDTTLREAIAFGPQSSTGDRLNLALWRIWNRMGRRVQVLAQLHDALYFQYSENDDTAEIITEALSCIDIPLWHCGRRFSVPGEPKTGWNWAAHDETTNPEGLHRWHKEKPDQRRRQTGLNRRL